MKKKFGFKVLNNIVITGIVLTLGVLLLTPWGLSNILQNQFNIDEFNTIISITIGIYMCSIPYVLALFLLKKICKKLITNDWFSRKIPKYLKQISTCAFSEILIFNIAVLVLYNFFDIYLQGMIIFIAVVVSFVCLAIGFLSMVLGKLFEVVIEIKDENDKTI